VIGAALPEPAIDPAELVEDELQRQLAADPEVVGAPMGRLVAAGGKRLRPHLAMLTGQLGPEYVAERSARLAAAIELIHSATLVHDDVVDGSALRRGLPTVGSSHGNRVAGAVGVYYFAKAAAILAELGCAEVTRTVMAAVRTVCDAQIQETYGRAAAAVDVAAYVEIAGGKTGALLEAAAVAGAELSRADQEIVTAVREFAGRVGLAFQMVDDVIDFEAATGKPVGQDLRAGVPSLPVIVALESPVGEELAAALADPAGVARAVELVRRSGVLDTVLERAETLAREAVLALAPLPPGEVRAELEALARHAVTRRA
jgi:geranylgeranyl pyrophosphate synthase